MTLRNPHGVARRMLGLSLEDVAVQIGISLNSLSKYERGRMGLRRGNKVALEKYLATQMQLRGFSFPLNSSEVKIPASQAPSK